jgi:uncharacterized membrane protein
MSNATEAALAAPCQFAGVPASARIDRSAALATGDRLVFIDAVRAAAVLFMIQGHSLHVLLAPSYQTSALFDAWLFLRGLTSCTFLLLAGFSFSLATVRHWDDHLVLSDRAQRRLRRFGFFLLLGYSMRFPLSPIGGLLQVSSDRWRYAAAVDVLQLVAVSLIGLQALAAIARTPARFARIALGLSSLVVLAAPLAWGIDWTAVLPMPAAAYLSDATGSLFPFLPWGAYPLLGAALGVGCAACPEGGAGFARRVLLPAGALMSACGLALHQLPVALPVPVDFWKTSPNLFLIKAGAVLLVVGAVAHASRGLRRLPAPIQALSQESLLVYFVHVSVLYGSIWSLGLTQWVGADLALGPTVLWIAALLASMTALAWVWSQCKRHQPHVARLSRLAVAASIIAVIT